MAYWEFLLQQDGDRTWLPLETAHVEILEGRYRVVAHSSHSNIPVDIHLIQLFAEQMPPKRRVLKRQGRTNDEGLMVVMPFTHLTAGTWTIRCHAALKGDSSGDLPEPIDYGVQLRVVPVEDDPDNWVPDWDMPEDEPLPAALQALAEPLAEPAPGPQITPAASSLPTATADLSGAAGDFPEIDAQHLGTLPLRLRLEQQALMSQPQTPLVLTGEVIAIADAPALPGVGSLGLQLRDPEQGQVVARLSQAIAWTTLPTAFEITVPVPDVPGTRLLVGEMSLWQGTAQVPQIMAIQGFTVTTNLDRLLEAVTQRGDVDLTFQEDAALEDASSPGQAALPETANPGSATGKVTPLVMPAVREVPFRLIYLPASGLTLPPQIQPADADREGRSLALPTLPNQAARPVAKAASTPQRPLELPLIGSDLAPPTPSVADAPDVASDVASAPERPLTLPTFGKAPPESGPLPADASADPSQEPWFEDSPDQNHPDQRDPSSPSEPLTTVPSLVPDAEFTALNLKDRFWGRLTALAQEGHAAAAGLKREMEAAGVEADLNPKSASTSEPPTVEPPPTMAVTAPSHEVVIYESERPLADNPTGVTPEATPSDPPAADVVETLVVPVPQFELPEAALVAGGALTLTVSLPPFPHRLAVKFWMTDIQNRSLIEKPRWLMNWTPSLEGQLEALLYLQVPMGCLEVRFEAIAVDLATQEESHKVTLQRPIVASQGAIAPLEDLP
ncbi:MAG: hypothetical protein HC812_03200 [Leptolyngbya sp. RL_3_1]|nr:hypothetical protein [Leptolyngbya sp. RL_3_1]